jgi:hypothetical protein
MHINLNEGRIANTAEAMDLAGLDDKDVAGAGFEVLPIDRPDPPAFAHELDFIVRMTMGSWTTPGKSTEEEDGDIDVPVFGSHELMGAALKRQVLLPDAVHVGASLVVLDPD